MGSKFIHTPSGHEKSHWDSYDPPEGSYLHCLNQTNTQPKSSLEAELVDIDDAMGKYINQCKPSCKLKLT